MWTLKIQQEEKTSETKIQKRCGVHAVSSFCTGTIHIDIIDKFGSPDTPTVYISVKVLTALLYGLINVVL